MSTPTEPLSEPRSTPSAASAGGIEESHVPHVDPGPAAESVRELQQAARRSSRRLPKPVALAAFVAPVVATAVIGSRFGPRGSTGRWYDGLRKPPFQPPAEVFAPVWTALYASIAWSGYRVYVAPDHPARRPALALWAAQLAANAAWTPTFFGAREPRAALAVLGTQLATTIGYTAAAGKVDGPAAALMAPYLAWSGFAGALNEEIVRLNPGVGEIA